MNTNLFSLEGKVALVTGAGRGLGQGMALGLAAAGADIAGLGRQACTETAELVRGMGRRFQDITYDLGKASPADMTGVVESVVAELGSLDILLNNAGIIRRAPIFEFSEADWDDVLQINLKAVFLLSQAAARLLAAQGGGKIINIASMLSFQGGIFVPSY
jgi:2-deoxy-D-gluconate 3-dehydrogenase